MDFADLSLSRMFRRAAFMIPMLGGLVLGCQPSPSNAPNPGGTGDGSRSVSGVVVAPPIMHKANAGSWDGFRGPLNESPLASASVFLLGARGEDLGIAPVTTDANGQFRFDNAPAEAGLLAAMPAVPDAYKPLMSSYQRGRNVKLGVASTLVAGALQTAITRNEKLTYASFDPAKIAELEAQVAAKFNDTLTVVSLHYLDQVLIDWARNDTALKSPLEALSPGITAPFVGPTPPPGLKK